MGNKRGTKGDFGGTESEQGVNLVTLRVKTLGFPPFLAFPVTLQAGCFQLTQSVPVASLPSIGGTNRQPCFPVFGLAGFLNVNRQIEWDYFFREIERITND